MLKSMCIEEKPDDYLVIARVNPKIMRSRLLFVTDAALFAIVSDVSFINHTFTCFHIHLHKPTIFKE